MKIYLFLCKHVCLERTSACLNVISVTWMKEGRALKDTDRYRISHSQSSSRFEILKVTAADEGHYTCCASNPEGTSQAAFSLVVRLKDKK